MAAYSINSVKLFFTVCAGLYFGTEVVHLYFDPATEIINRHKREMKQIDDLMLTKTNNKLTNELISKSLDLNNK